MKTVKVKYHDESAPELHFVGGYDKSCAIDLYTREDFTIKSGQFGMIDLGVSIELPEGYMALMMPRSSTFKKYGIIQTNSIGLIDESYKGDNDIYNMPVFRPITSVDMIKLFSDFAANLFCPTNEKDRTPIMATNMAKVKNALDMMEMMKGMIMPGITGAVIPKGTNICQILVLPRMEMMEFVKVNKLDNPDRDGFGSTDKEAK